MNTISSQRVVNIVAEIAGRAPESLTPETDLYADLELDSLSTLELLVALEDEFHVDIGTEEAQRIRTIADITPLLAELLSPPRKR
jgi:acyl carrier protein